MKAIELTSHAPETFRVSERPMPRPRRGELVVRMFAASINYRDHQIAGGTYHENFQLPLVPLSDGVGEVVSVGDDVARFKPGDRVAGTFWQSWIAGPFDVAYHGSTLGGPRGGMLAEYVCLDEQGAVSVPAHLSDEEAATLPCAGVTAWRALISQGRLQAGDTVFVEGTGGVSTFALQFARLSGARVIVASHSPAKLGRARELGATACVRYDVGGDWAAEVLRLTEDRGVDHIVDVGGPASFAQAVRTVRPGGQINVVGYLGGMAGEINPLQILAQQVQLRGLQVGPRSCFEDMNRAIAVSGLRPVIDRVFAWTEIAEALRRLRDRQHFGKIVLKF